MNEIAETIKLRSGACLAEVKTFTGREKTLTNAVALFLHGTYIGGGGIYKCVLRGSMGKNL